MSETDDEQSFDDFAQLSIENFEKTVTDTKAEKEMLKIQKQQEREQRRQLAEQEREQRRYFKEQQKMIKEQEKEEKKNAKQNKEPKTERVSFSINESTNETEQDSIFSDSPTEIQGRDKLVLLAKISQFRQLFPEKLKTFKIRKNSSVDDLKSYLVEMESIVEVSNVDEFLYDSIIKSIQIVEGVSAMTKNYNVKGMSEMLKLNVQFKNLVKLMFIKYHIFSAVPVEYQLVMICSTTAMICMQKNRQSEKINEYLNQKI